MKNDISRGIFQLMWILMIFFVRHIQEWLFSNSETMRKFWNIYMSSKFQLTWDGTKGIYNSDENYLINVQISFNYPQNYWNFPKMFVPKLRVVSCLPQFFTLSLPLLSDFQHKSKRRHFTWENMKKIHHNKKVTLFSLSWFQKSSIFCLYNWHWKRKQIGLLMITNSN